MRSDHRENTPNRTARFPRRGTDRLEDAVAWLLGSLALLTLLVTVLTAFSVYTDGTERARAERADRTPVLATLLEDAPMASTRDQPVRHLVAARWVGPDGLEHTGAVPVSGILRAGTEVGIWIDESGRPTDPPATVANAVVATVLAALGIGLLGGAVLGAAWLGVRALTGSRNAAGWEREWAETEPRWSGRTT